VRLLYLTQILDGEEAISVSEKDIETNSAAETPADLLEKVSRDLPEDEILYDLAELFKIFGDTTRIKILYALFESELCVYDIARLLNLSQSAISHQLKILKANKLVKYRREGKTVFYSLADAHVFSIISQGMEHICE
jgi:DNA-binding transcriptional ArsR family regulator